MIYITNNLDGNLRSLSNVDSQQHKKFLTKKTDLTAPKHFLNNSLLLKIYFQNQKTLQMNLKKTKK